jgi:Flp pilus assembly protein CpaB
LQKVVVASEPISANSMIRKDQVKLVSRANPPPDPVTDINSVVGRSAKAKLRPAQVVRESDLFPKTNQLSYFIPLYRRAVTIPVSNYNNLSYMLRPGDQVDLYVYLPQGYVRGTGTNQQNADVLGSDVLQKVSDAAQILSLNDVFTKKEVEQIESGGQNKQAQQFTYQEMTLGVTLWEAEKINLIRGQQQAGNQNIRFFVILRPHQLQSSYGYRSVNNYDLFGRSLGNATSRDVSGPQVQVIQGQERETYRVQDYR